MFHDLGKEENQGEEVGDGHKAVEEIGKGPGAGHGKDGAEKGAKDEEEAIEQLPCPAEEEKGTASPI